MLRGPLARIGVALMLGAGLLPLTGGSAAAAPNPRAVALSFAQRATFDQPVGVVAARDGSGRLFVLERPGVIRVYRNGAAQSTPYLDIRDRVSDDSGERGLLGLAFSPTFSRDRLLWVAYTVAGGNLRISRFQAATAAATTVAPTSSRFLFDVPHSRTNHNAGQLAFTRDGLLLIGTGDSGGTGDPDNLALSLQSLSGKVLRIDPRHVCSGKYYCIPTANPLRGKPGVRQEIWMYGARNPWRFSVDRGTGNVWLADVGQSKQEEVSVIAGTFGGPANLGWSCYEGRTVYNSARCAGIKNLVHPRFTYEQVDGGRCGASIIGGFVYRGTRYASLMGGLYIYGDYCHNRVALHGSGISDLAGSLDGVAAFGESDAGEIWAVSVVTGGLYEMSARQI